MKNKETDNVLKVSCVANEKTKETVTNMVLATSSSTTEPDDNDIIGGGSDNN